MLAEVLGAERTRMTSEAVRVVPAFTSGAFTAFTGTGGLGEEGGGTGTGGGNEATGGTSARGATTLGFCSGCGGTRGAWTLGRGVLGSGVSAMLGAVWGAGGAGAGSACCIEAGAVGGRASRGGVGRTAPTCAGATSSFLSISFPVREKIVASRPAPETMTTTAAINCGVVSFPANLSPCSKTT